MGPELRKWEESWVSLVPSASRLLDLLVGFDFCRMMGFVSLSLSLEIISFMLRSPRSTMLLFGCFLLCMKHFTRVIKVFF